MTDKNEIEKATDNIVNSIWKGLKFCWTGAILSFVFCFLWKFTNVYNVFGLPELDYFQALAIYFIINILFPIRLLKGGKNDNPES